MDQLPDELIQEIILQKIILLKNSNGWKDIHDYITNFELGLRLTLYQYPYEYHFNNIYRSTFAVKPKEILKRSRLIWIHT